MLGDLMTHAELWVINTLEVQAVTQLCVKNPGM